MLQLHAKVSDTRPETAGQSKNVLSAERNIHTRDARIEKPGSQNVVIVRGHMFHPTKGVQNTKKQAFRQHVVSKEKTFASINQNSLLQPETNNNETFSFTAEQLTKFVANVLIHIAQPQVCYPNPKHDTLDLKSSMCRKVSNAVKTILNADITGKDLFESIGSLSTPAPPVPFKFTSTKVNPASKLISKASIVLKSISLPSKIPKATPKQPETSK